MILLTLFTSGTGRGDAYNLILDKLDVLTIKLKEIGDKYNVSPTQVAISWAIYKGTLPIIGVTKVEQVEEAMQATKIKLTNQEVMMLEKCGDNANISTLREWKKYMI